MSSQGRALYPVWPSRSVSWEIIEGNCLWSISAKLNWDHWMYLKGYVLPRWWKECITVLQSRLQECAAWFMMKWGSSWDDRRFGLVVIASQLCSAAGRCLSWEPPGGWWQQLSFVKANRVLIAVAVFRESQLGVDGSRCLSWEPPGGWWQQMSFVKFTWNLPLLIIK